MSGISFADIYGGPVASRLSEPPPTAEAASQQSMIADTSAPTISWLGVFLVLVALRVLYELAE